LKKVLKGNENSDAFVGKKEMLRITSLNVNDYKDLGIDKISSLNGLEYAANLQKLVLDNQNISDLTPIANLTKTEVCELGLLLDLPKELVIKIPSDGLSGKSDEEKLGFTYSSLDTFIRTGEKDKAIDKILSAHKKTAHKRGEIAKYTYNKTNHFYKEN